MISLKKGGEGERGLKYIEFKLKDLGKIAENIRSTKSDKVEERLEELEARIGKYEEVLEKIDS